jgi:hypothetical protein
MANAAESAIHDATSLLHSELEGSAAPEWWRDSVVQEQENRTYFDPLIRHWLDGVRNVVDLEFKARLKLQLPVEQTCEELRKIVREHCKLEEILEPICVLRLPAGVAGWPGALEFEQPVEFSSRMILKIEEHIGRLGRFHDASANSPAKGGPIADHELPNRVRGRGRPRSVLVAKRREVIQRISATGVTGESYCRAMDARGLSTPFEWCTREGCPKSYLEAWNHCNPTKRGKFRSLIKNEKHKMTKSPQLAQSLKATDI